MKLWKVQAGKAETLRAWGQELMTTHKVEAEETLREERCTHEFFEVFEVNGEHYALGHMEGLEVLPSTDRELNKKHRAVLEECLGERLETTSVYDLRAD